MTDFQRQVYEAVRKIPKGETRTYKQVAMAVGKPGAYRAVGTALKMNTDHKTPCHRVIKSDGSLGRYNGMLGEKAKLLKTEGAL